MGDELKKTIKIKRGEKLGADSRGRNVWTKPIKEVELELVSTVMLQRIIDSGDENQQDRIRELAQGEDGVLARSTDTNELEVIRDAELQAALEGAATSDQPSLESIDSNNSMEELSLVSTQALRQILKIDGDVDDSEPEPDSRDEGGGYNPYDSG